MQKFTSFFLILFISSWSFAGNLRCDSFFIEPEKKPLFFELPNNLREDYKKEIQGLSADDIKKLNSETLLLLDRFKPQASGKRALEIPYKTLRIIFGKLLGEFSGSHMQKYDQKSCVIGYCFGRAYLAHIMLLKWGLQPESIRKVWVVGNLKTNEDNLNWEFHVATMAYTQHLGWVVLDANLNEPVSMRNWMSHYMNESVDQRARFYITDPRKFGLVTGRYSRLEMGFKHSRDEDWYKHYFVDQTDILRELKLEELGR